MIGLRAGLSDLRHSLQGTSEAMNSENSGEALAADLQIRGPTASQLARGDVVDARGLTYRPYWWDAAPRRQSVAVSPRQTDVVIVGSGFTGLSAALTLLRQGRSVVVLERDVPGYGASTRNGGQIGSGNQKFKVKRLIELRGLKKAEAMLREGVRMLDYIADLIASEKIDCHFSRCGRFRAAMQPEHYESMARDMEDLRQIAGVESFMVPRAEQHSEIGSDVFFGGSVLPGDASLHPALFHAGLMQRIEERGGTLLAMRLLKTFRARIAATWSRRRSAISRARTSSSRPMAIPMASCRSSAVGSCQSVPV